MHKEVVCDHCGDKMKLVGEVVGTLGIVYWCQECGTLHCNAPFSIWSYPKFEKGKHMGVIKDILFVATIIIIALAFSLFVGYLIV